MSALALPNVADPIHLIDVYLVLLLDVDEQDVGEGGDNAALLNRIHDKEDRLLVEAVLKLEDSIHLVLRVVVPEDAPAISHE